LCVAQQPSAQPVRFTAHLGGTFPLHTGSMGKLLLAFTDDAERAQLLDQLPLEAITRRTITDRRTLELELADIRRVGFAVSRGGRAAGVAWLSAPVFGADGRILAALAIIGPESRLGDPVLARSRAPLLAAAHDVTRQIAAQRRKWTGATAHGRES